MTLYDLRPQHALWRHENAKRGERAEGPERVGACQKAGRAGHLTLVASLARTQLNWRPGPDSHSRARPPPTSLPPRLAPSHRVASAGARAQRPQAPGQQRAVPRRDVGGRACSNACFSARKAPAVPVTAASHRLNRGLGLPPSAFSPTLHFSGGVALEPEPELRARGRSCCRPERPVRTRIRSPCGSQR